MTNDKLGKDAVNARIAQHCELFGLEPCKIKSRKDSVYMTDELLDWCRLSGASLDWILLGDIRCLAGAFKARCDEEREINDVFSHFDEVELEQMAAAMKKGIGTDSETFEKALQDFDAFVRDRRASRAAAA